ncbi:hypothetical protein GX51_02326 [Blastomyces parvus]|uniref:Uncharacterized protein n=1 Tax=Blastomyces parvus TaxID=2060905 RepID=A0A2B7XCN6_9EURO|nr:hypothetical protein GX51_02326 [Blastomyces parvus]
MHFFDTILPLALVALSTADAAAIVKAPRSGDLVPNSYIVVMKANTSDDKFESHRSWVSNKLSAGDSAVTNGGVRKEYNLGSQFRGYSGVFGDDAIKQISDDEDVAFVEQNTVVTLDNLRIQTSPPSWGLGRISSPAPGLNSPYVYDSAAGEGITAYIVDSGIDVKHPDFDDRAIWGTNTVDSLDEDCGNHGTHVAGTIGGNRHGVAKKVKLVGIKVFGCDVKGSIQDIVEGMVWAVQHSQEHGDPNKSVMNLSLGSAYSAAFNYAAAAVVRMGFFVAVSAGNDAIDAAKKSPASEPIVCTIGATDANDKIADFSNFGSGVDLFAPGVGIVSTIPGGNTDAMSGTSMAAPHVAGLAAVFMARENIAGPSVCDRLKDLATNSVHGMPEGTTQKLLFNGVHRRSTRPSRTKFSKNKRPSTKKLPKNN